LLPLRLFFVGVGFSSVDCSCKNQTSYSSALLHECISIAHTYGRARARTYSVDEYACVYVSIFLLARSVPYVCYAVARARAHARRRLEIVRGSWKPCRKSADERRAHGTTRHDTIITTLDAIRLSRRGPLNRGQPNATAFKFPAILHPSARSPTRPHRRQRLRLARAAPARSSTARWRLMDVDAASPPTTAIARYVAAATFLTRRRELWQFPAFSRGAEMYGVQTNESERDGEWRRRRRSSPGRSKKKHPPSLATMGEDVRTYVRRSYEKFTSEERKEGSRQRQAEAGI
jgi:hypothetical protein